MGAPIDDFIVASNSNDILTRFVNDGDMTTRDVVPTLSPSMDIQVSSNFERLLFEMNGRDGGMTAEQLARFRATGALADRARPARRVHRRLVPRRPLRRRRDARRDRPRARRDRHADRPAHRHRHGRRPPPRRGRRPARRWSRWPRPTRPSSPTPSSAPPACGPPLPAASRRPVRPPRAHADAAERSRRGAAVRALGVAPRLSRGDAAATAGGSAASLAHAFARRLRVRSAIWIQ